MASLPTGIITEILSRLPVKSLTRFLCVNKSWFSLIKSPNFIKLHLNKTLISNSEDYLIIVDRSIYIAEFNHKDVSSPLSFSEFHHPLISNELMFINSCNGVLCVSDFTQNNVFLYNPLTKSHRKLPVKRIRDFKTEWNDRIVYGFGYDSSMDDYKVFCFFQKRNMWNIEFNEAEVFSFKSNSWKPIEGMCKFDSIANHHGVYLNEAMYYVVLENESDFDFDSRCNFIAKFDFRTDTVVRVECPNFDKIRAEWFLSLSVLDGCLCMLVSYFPEDSFPEANMGMQECPLIRVDLWMMKRSGENEAWVKLFSISDPQGIGIQSAISTVAFSKDRSKILLVVDDSRLVWYDLDSGLLETVIARGLPEFCRSSELRYISGSLVSLVDDKLQLEGRRTTKKENKRNSDNFLSVGFKLKL